MQRAQIDIHYLTREFDEKFANKLKEFCIKKDAEDFIKLSDDGQFGCFSILYYLIDLGSKEAKEFLNILYEIEQKNLEKAKI